MLRASVWLTAAVSAILALSIASADAAGHKHAGIPAYITAAVADPARPDADKKVDAERKPAETLAFSHVKPGDSVAELMPGGGYFTRMLSALVGPSGHVYAIVPPPMPPMPPRPGMRMRMDMGAAAKAIAADPHYSNVTVLTTLGTDNYGLPGPVDLVWTTDNYHDFHNGPHADIAAFNKLVFDSLKPGGIFLVVDHAGAAGTDDTQTSTLHRIDPASARKEIEAAGFKLVAHSNALRNPKDPHTARIFDASIRGHTDKFMYRFVKPAA
jgi:predicted methyltransferase